MNWLTLVLGVLLIGALFSGYGRGLIGMVVGLVGYVIAMFVAGRYATTVRDWMQNTWHTTDRLAHWLQTKALLPPELNQIPASALTYDRLLQILKAVPLPESYKEALARSLVQHPPAGMSVAQYLLHRLAEGMMEAICFVLVAAVVSWVLFWVAGRLNLTLNRIPVVGGANHLAGAAVGGIFMAVTLSVILGYLTPFLSMQTFSGLAGAVQASPLAQWLIGLYPLISHIIAGRPWLLLAL